MGPNAFHPGYAQPSGTQEVPVSAMLSQYQPARPV